MLAPLKLLTNFKILTVTRFKDPKASILTLENAKGVSKIKRRFIAANDLTYLQVWYNNLNFHIEFFFLMGSAYCSCSAGSIGGAHKGQLHESDKFLIRVNSEFVKTRRQLSWESHSCVHHIFTVKACSSYFHSHYFVKATPLPATQREIMSRFRNGSIHSSCVSWRWMSITCSFSMKTRTVQKNYRNQQRVRLWAE